MEDNYYVWTVFQSSDQKDLISYLASIGHGNAEIKQHGSFFEAIIKNYDQDDDFDLISYQLSDQPVTWYHISCNSEKEERVPPFNDMGFIRVNTNDYFKSTSIKTYNLKETFAGIIDDIGRLKYNLILSEEFKNSKLYRSTLQRLLYMQVNGTMEPEQLYSEDNLFPDGFTTLPFVFKTFKKNQKKIMGRKKSKQVLDMNYNTFMNTFL